MWLLISCVLLQTLSRFLPSYRRLGNVSFFYLTVFECSVLSAFAFCFFKQSSISIAKFGLFSGADLSKKMLYTIICCTVVLAIDYFSYCLAIRQPATSGQSAVQRLATFHSSSFVNRIFILIFCVVTGVWEELFFRGFLFSVFSQFEVSIWLVVFLSSVLFACYHITGGIKQFYYSLFYGFVFSILLVLTQSLIGVVISHILGNIYILIVVGPRLQRRKNPIFF